MGSHQSSAPKKTIASHAGAGKQNGSSVTESVYNGSTNGHNTPAFSADKAQAENSPASSSKFSANAGQNSSVAKNINGLLHQNSSGSSSAMVQFQQQHQNVIVAEKDASHALTLATVSGTRGEQNTPATVQGSQTQPSGYGSRSRNNQAQDGQSSTLPETGMLNDGIVLVAASLALVGMVLNRKKRK